MKNYIWFLIMFFASHSVFAGEPKALACDRNQIEKAAIKFIGLNISVQDILDVEIRDVNVLDWSEDLNQNELTKSKVTWGFKTGEMASDNYVLEIGLSSSSLEVVNGKVISDCHITSAVEAEIVY